MGKKLVIVESPAKAKTINKILGPDYVVASSVGHVRDLPERKMGVDIEQGFQPQYVLVKGKKSVVENLKKQAKTCDTIYLAPDPDREGEAIAWHIETLLKPENQGKPFYRVQYNEITPQAVLKAFSQPGTIDMRRVNAQQARRILDRIVGYMVSPMLWRKIRRGLSAGRVQSVALRLVCEREEQIRNFRPEPYWIIGARARKLVEPLDPFLLRLVRINGEKAEIKSKERAAAMKADLEGRSLRVKEIVRREICKRPPPPFITSSLQQAASSRLGFSPKRTMSIAQRLYEGIDLGDGPVGLITYMRTDSVAVSREAQEAARALVLEQFGKEYCPEVPNVYRSRDSAQEAHEAIRPTDVRRRPEDLRGKLDAAEMKLYKLIWERFVASQMTPAVITQRTVKVEAPPQGDEGAAYLFQATASDVKFPGYMRVAGVEQVEKTSEKGEETAQFLPELSEGEQLECLEWLSERRETKPPARYTEAALVRALENNGIGRPSTYAQIIATLHERKYVVTEKRTLIPTELGERVNRLLVQTLDPLFNVKFTASMETELDEIEAGKIEWTGMLANFYRQFREWMTATEEPPADRNASEKLLACLAKVKEWPAPVKQGKRTFDEKKFVDSLRKQFETGRKTLTNRQLTALARIAVRYTDRVPEIKAVLDEIEQSGVLGQLTAPPSEATLKKLDLVRNLALDDYSRGLVDSLRDRVASGRDLTEPQMRALGRVVLRHAGQIENFENLRPELELGTSQAPAEDRESAELLAALRSVSVWSEPVTRGKLVFDDRNFYESLARHFARNHCLSDRQKAALKKMVRRYRSQIPDYEALAERYGLEIKTDVNSR